MQSLLHFIMGWCDNRVPGDTKRGESWNKANILLENNNPDRKLKVITQREYIPLFMHEYIAINLYTVYSP